MVVLVRGKAFEVLKPVRITRVLNPEDFAKKRGRGARAMSNIAGQRGVEIHVGNNGDHIQL